MTAKEEFEEKLESSRDNSKRNEAERKLWEGGYSPRAMYGTWALSGLATIVALVAVGLAGGSSTLWMITGAVLVLLWAGVIGTYLYRSLSMRYELTTQRFIHQTGILIRHTDRIEVIDIDDVSYTQGIIQRMLGVGTISVISSDRSHPELVMYGIEKVPEIASLIDDIRREERRRRSLHIEQI